MSIVLYPRMNWSIMRTSVLVNSNISNCRPVAIPKTLEKMATNATKTLGHSQPLNACPGTSTVSWDRQLIPTP